MTVRTFFASRRWTISDDDKMKSLAASGLSARSVAILYHTDNMARTRQYFHVATDEGRSFPLRPWLINASLTKFGRAFGETSSALGSFLRWCSGIDNLFDRLCGELLSTQDPAGLADGPHCCLRLEPELDQAANYH